MLRKLWKKVKLAFKIIGNNFVLLGSIFKVTKKGKIKTVLELLRYKLKYKINIEDYLSLQFYNMTERQVSTFFTYGMNNALVDRLNDRKRKDIFEDKEQFDAIFKDFLGRELISNKTSFENFKKFIAGKKYIFYKKKDGNRGIGAKKINVEEYRDIKQFYQDIRKLDVGILEDLVVPHKNIRKMCDSGLSTVRLITINLDGKLVVLDSVFMMVNGGVVNCEVTGGGLSACIDIKTGKVITDGVDVNRKFYKKHPISGEVIKGFQIPYWNEILKLASKIYDKVPGVNYVGWDIAVTDSGPIVIEGNASWPSHRIWQIPYLREKKGKRNEVESKLPFLKERKS